MITTQGLLLYPSPFFPQECVVFSVSKVTKINLKVSFFCNMNLTVKTVSVGLLRHLFSARIFSWTLHTRFETPGSKEKAVIVLWGPRIGAVGTKGT